MITRNVPYLYEVNWQTGHRKWFLNTNLFLIKSFLDPFHLPLTGIFNCTLYNKLIVQSTGTPLIGRFLGPRKNRLNRNPSY